MTNEIMSGKIKHMINQKLTAVIYEEHLQINKKKQLNGFTNQISDNHND